MQPVLVVLVVLVLVLEVLEALEALEALYPHRYYSQYTGRQGGSR
jgi:hypothetical protein